MIRSVCESFGDSQPHLQLKQALATAQASPYAEWTLRERTPIKDVLLRADGGMALVGGVFGFAGWVKSSR